MAADGSEVTLSSLDAFLVEVREGRVGPDTLVFDEQDRRWKPAVRWPGYEAVRSLIEPLETAAAPHAGEAAWSRAPAGPAAPPETGHPPRPSQAPESAPLGPPERPKHGVRGHLYVGLCYLGAGLLAFAGLVVWVLAIDTGDGGVGFLLFVLMGAFGTGSFFLGRGVWRFSTTARLVALVLAYTAIAGAVLRLIAPEDGPEAVGALLSLPFNIAFVHYFHTRRQDFARSRMAPLAPPSPERARPDVPRYRCPNCEAETPAYPGDQVIRCHACDRKMYVA
jgi:hypothetical protein